MIFLLILLTSFGSCECEPPSACDERMILDGACCENQRLYHSLDCWGKCRAIELSKECESIDCAIETAAREMACRQRGEYPNQKTYKKRTQEQSNQNLYDERFGY
ncbi:MAG: hypothetical protein P0S96_08355 [Simkaniaceae bacterium]|nr:hypothetical protein [Candidatus Sacchlamyda saccharinae]